MSVSIPEDLLHYSSLSHYFIDNIRNDESFDFTLDQIMILCDIEPENCQHVFSALETSVSEKGRTRPPVFDFNPTKNLVSDLSSSTSYSSNNNKKPVRFPDELPHFKEDTTPFLVTNQGSDDNLSDKDYQTIPQYSKPSFSLDLDLVSFSFYLVLFDHFPVKARRFGIQTIFDELVKYLEFFWCLQFNVTVWLIYIVAMKLCHDSLVSPCFRACQVFQNMCS